METSTKVVLTKEEAEEIERFRKRREHFSSFLSVANIHNVPDFYPVMYKKMFATDTFGNGNNLFCVGGARYCDQNEEVVNKYEKALTEGYIVK